jgi:acyl-CoA thioesterase FadM
MFRTILFFLRRRPTMAVGEVGRMTFHVLPTDLDFAGHMNNGMYFSIMDLGRIDLLRRFGVWWKLLRAGITPVMAQETIAFRKPLKLGTRFVIESRVIGVDDRSLYLEHRAVVGGEIYTRATMRMRFAKKTGGAASIDEVEAVGGVVFSTAAPEGWIVSWREHTALPSARAAAPSEWA